MRKANELLPQYEVARIMGVSRSAVAQKIDAKHLEYQEIGGIRFVPWRAVVQWQKQRAERARKLTEFL